MTPTTKDTQKKTDTDIVASNAATVLKQRGVSLKRPRGEVSDEDIKPEPLPVSSAAIDKAIDLAFAPSREMLPSVTIIDRFQGRLFPIVSLINIIWDDVLQVAAYRQDRDAYRREYKRNRPVSSSWLDELLYRTALWQKSVGGTNLTKITDIALAEMEGRAGEDEGMGANVDAWGKE